MAHAGRDGTLESAHFSVVAENGRPGMLIDAAEDAGLRRVGPGERHCGW